MADPAKIKKIFNTLVMRTARKEMQERKEVKKLYVQAYFEICLHEYMITYFDMDEQIGSIIKFHPAYPSDKNDNKLEECDNCIFEYEHFKKIRIEDALELVNLVRDVLDKPSVSI